MTGVGVVLGAGGAGATAGGPIDPCTVAVANTLEPTPADVALVVPLPAPTPF